MEEVDTRIIAMLEEHRAKFPLRWGAAKEEIRSRLPRELAVDIFQERLERLAAAGRLQLRRDRVRGGADELALPAVAANAARDLLARFDAARMAPPSVTELAAGWPHRGIDLGDLLDLLAERGDLSRVAPDLYYLTAHLDRAREAVLRKLDGSGEIGVPDFKALFDISRKWAVPLLELFDREGTTRRVGDKRVRGRTT
jgi:selenocysteine-specific elongation factor